MGNESCEVFLQGMRNDEAHLVANYSSRFILHKKADKSFMMGYDPELDASPELEPDVASYFQTIICILRWMTEHGRIDIITIVFPYQVLHVPMKI